LLVAGLIDATASKFLSMVMIILSDADHVFRKWSNRRGELGVAERNWFTVFRGCSLAKQPDDMAQIAHRCAADRKWTKVVILNNAKNLSL